MLTYMVILTPEPDGSAITVTVPAMPGVVTWGATPDDALDSAREAIELHLESYVERDRPFPPDIRRQSERDLTIDVMPPSRAPESAEKHW